MPYFPNSPNYSATLTFVQRSDTTANVALPGATDFGICERLVIGSGFSVEIPATSSLTIYNVS